MPTKAVTGTKQMKTTRPPDDTEATTGAPDPGSDPQAGVFRRRNFTDDNGKVHNEELRPNEDGQRRWVEVD